MRNAQRQFKYRMWDNVDKTMSFFQLKDDNVDCKLYDAFQKEDTKGRYAVMQFAGVVDFSDIDVYEGDILNWEAKDGDTTTNTRGHVVFQSGCYCFIDANNKLTALMAIEKAEVVGNIFENPGILLNM